MSERVSCLQIASEKSSSQSRSEAMLIANAISVLTQNALSVQTDGTDSNKLMLVPVEICKVSLHGTQQGPLNAAATHIQQSLALYLPIVLGLARAAC